jgi:hypothetical protein
MALNARSIRHRLGAVLAERRAAVAVALMLLMLGLYPGPAFILFRDPAWRTHPIVAQFVDERAFWIAGLVVFVGPAMVLASMAPRRFDRLWEALRSRLDGAPDHWYVAGAALFTASGAALAGTYMLAQQPATSDEIAQLWHARILLAGNLTLPPDPNPEFFAVDNVIDRDRWYSQFPIGGPAAFAIAMRLRATWLLNPILASLTVVNVYRFASRVYGTNEARVSALFCATCPFLLMMSGSYMNHTLVAFLATLALAELPVWAGGTGRRQRIAGIIVALSLGSAIAVRPLDGAIAAAVAAAFMVSDAMQRARLRALLVPAAAGAVPIAGLLAANWLTTGDPLLFGYEVLWGENHALGFHDDPSGNAHTPARALALAVAYVMQLNWALFEWPIAGLVLVGGALVAIGRLERWEIILLLWIEVQLIAYAAYWHAGLFLGPRYLFTVVPALLILAARGVVLVTQRAAPTVRRIVVAGVGASLLSTWLIPSTPVGALGIIKSVRPVRTAFKMDLDPVVRSLDGSPALIFVSETASTRLMRRLWGLGISRPDAARLMADKDHCALLEAAVEAARRDGSPDERLLRLAQVKSYAPPPGVRLQAPDAAFRISDVQSLTPRCRDAAMQDAARGQSISYGLTLLRNEIGPDGRITGPIVFVADLAEHNEVLRARFSDRRWYRLEPPSAPGSRVPRLVPYE